MEYADGGDLYSLIKHNKKHKKTFTEDELWRFSFEILQGIDYLHSNNIIHRDIKCLNLFLTKDKKIKIGDLGVSKIVSNINALHCTRVGTPLYLSPELIKQIPYDFKVDIWSIGCSLYHLACLEPPFNGDNLIVLGNNIVKAKPKAIPSIYSKNISEFVEKLLSKKSENRPSAKEAMSFIPTNIIEEYSHKKVSKKEKKDQDNVISYSPLDNIANNKDALEEKKPISPRPMSNIGMRNNTKRDMKNVEEKEELQPVITSVDSNNNKNNNGNGNGNINNINIFLKNHKHYKPSKLPTPKTNPNQVMNINGNNIFNKIPTFKTEGTQVNNTSSNNNIENVPADVPVNVPVTIKKNIKEDLNIMQNVENFMINTDEDGVDVNLEKEKETIIKIENSVESKSNLNNNKNISLNNSPIHESNSRNKHSSNKIISLDEVKSVEGGCDRILVNDNYNLNENQPMKRLLSSKLRNPNRFRPNTASNNKILANNHNLGSNFNFNSNENVKNTGTKNEYPQIKSSRPFTAFNKGRNQNNDLKIDNNNVINININFFNIDMNQRYIKPNPERNLIYINDSLFKKEKKANNSGSSLPPFTGRDNLTVKGIDSRNPSVSNRPQTGRVTQNNRAASHNCNNGKKSENELFFNKILKAIEGLNNNHKRQLTIDDLK